MPAKEAYLMNYFLGIPTPAAPIIPLILFFIYFLFPTGISTEKVTFFLCPCQDQVQCLSPQNAIMPHISKLGQFINNWLHVRTDYTGHTVTECVCTLLATTLEAGFTAISWLSRLSAYTWIYIAMVEKRLFSSLTATSVKICQQKHLHGIEHFLDHWRRELVIKAQLGLGSEPKTTDRTGAMAYML